MSPPQTAQQQTVIFWGLCAGAFNKQSMVQSEVRGFCVHPTWFTYNQDFYNQCFLLNQTEFSLLLFTCVALI